MSAPDAGLSRQAIKHYQSGQFREAEHLLRRLLERDPDNWQHVMLLGLSRHSQGDYDEAARRLKRAVQLGDGQPTTHYYYGRILTDTGHLSAAREQYAQAIALDPNHVESRTGMGLASLMGGKLERAVSELKTALRASPEYVPALTALARTLVELDRHDEAFSYANTALQVNPEGPASLDAMGRVLFGQGQLELAERCFRTLLEKRPESGEAHGQLAAVLKTAHRDHDALEHYTRALEKNYGGARLAIETSICLERIGDVPQARRLMQRAAGRWPGDRDVALRLAETTMLDDAPEAAREMLAGLDAGDPEVVTMQARVADYLGDTTQARALLEPVVEGDRDGELRVARMLLARVRSSEDPQDVENARAPIAAMLKRDPPTPDAVLVWSAICERAGNFDEACKALEDVLERGAITDPDRRVLHNRLANCYDQADNQAMAWANWQKSVWRIAPHAPRLQAQRDSGALARWLAWDWTNFETLNIDDGFPAPVIVAGWPGSGREILLTALAGHPGVTTLDPEGENRRLEALGLPGTPEVLVDTQRETLRIGRKRFMRGIRRGALPAVVLESGWWQASAIPALARHFPGATVVLPAADPDDLALQWRVDGYADVEAMIGEYRQELALWQKMRDRLDLNLIEIGRDELLDDVAGTVDKVFDALGLAPFSEAREQALRVRGMERFVPAGSGARYAQMRAEAVDDQPGGEASLGDDQTGGD